MKRLPWFRMYTEARTDRKLDLLTDPEHRVWHNLLLFSAEQPARGFIGPECLDDLAIECARGDETLMGHVLSRLVTLRIIAEQDGGWLFLHFEDRQHDYPSDRPQATRERKRKSRAVTSESREVTSGHAQEEKRVEEKEKEQAAREPKCFRESDHRFVADKVRAKFADAQDSDIAEIIEALQVGCDSHCSGLHSCWRDFLLSKLGRARSISGLLKFMRTDGRAA